MQTTPITPSALAGTRFVFGGYVKLDALWSKYTDGQIADTSPGRDFYVPSAIPVGAPAASEGVAFHSHIKQSRFQFGTDTDVSGGGTLSSRLEIDLYGAATGQGDDRSTNTYGLQVRQVYLQYQNWLVGQTWTNFQDAATLPETADYIGPTDGTVFVRQPMVRYTTGNLAVALENSQTTITPFGGGTRIASSDNSVPDVTAAYTIKFSQGYVRVAGLARQLKYQTTGVGAIDSSAFGAALSVAGKINVGRDDIRFTVTSGSGVGRYIGVNFTNDVVINGSGELDKISGWAAFAAYRHLWTSTLRSNVMISASNYDNDIASTGALASKSTRTWALNMFYTPIPKVDVGLEYRQARREIESGADGTMKRLQATVKYSF